MGSKSVIIALAIGIVAFWIYKSKSKKIVKKDNFPIESARDDDKLKITVKLNEIEASHSKNLINYYITLFADTELDNEIDRNSISEHYPRTISRKSFDFSTLFANYDSKLINECIAENLEKRGALNIDSSVSEPFLKFEISTKFEAEKKARVIFNDFFNIV